MKLAAAAGVLAAALAPALVSPQPTARSHSAAATVLFVDRESRGGACSDARTAAEAASAATPWCSLVRAVHAAPPDTTVAVRGGDYPELAVANDRRRTQPLIFRRHEIEPVTIAGLEVTNSSLLTFVGFVFTGNVDVTRSSAQVTLSKNEVRGVHVWLSRTSNVVIEGNRIHGLRGGSAIGIRLLGDAGTVIRGNVIEDLISDPIQVGEVRDVVIERNVLRKAHPDNGQHTDAIQVLGARGLTIRSNQVTDVAHGFMFTDAEARDVVIENNVVAHISNGLGLKAEGSFGMPGLRIVNNTWHDTRLGVDLRRSHPNAVVRNNIFDTVDGLEEQPAADHNLIARTPPGRRYGPNSIVARPRFVDSASLELARGSPGIDAGSAVGAPATDRQGRPRRDDPGRANTGVGGVRYTDIGAHERQPGRVTVPPRVQIDVVRRRGVPIQVEPPFGEPNVRIVLRSGARGTRATTRTRTMVVRGARAAIRIVLTSPVAGRYVVAARFGARAASVGAPVTATFMVVR